VSVVFRARLDKDSPCLEIYLSSPKLEIMESLYLTERTVSIYFKEQSYEIERVCLSLLWGYCPQIVNWDII
jgi:hypothetical protein